MYFIYALEIIKLEDCAINFCTIYRFCTTILRLLRILCIGRVRSRRVSNRSTAQIDKLLTTSHCTYVHCYAHTVNLVLVDTCFSVEAAGNCIGLLQAIHNFVTVSSVRHDKFVQVQKEQNEQVMELPLQSDTHWVCKLKAITDCFRLSKAWCRTAYLICCIKDMLDVQTSITSNAISWHAAKHTTLTSLCQWWKASATTSCSSLLMVASQYTYALTWSNTTDFQNCTYLFFCLCLVTSSLMSMAFG